MRSTLHKKAFHYILYGVALAIIAGIAYGLGPACLVILGWICGAIFMAYYDGKMASVTWDKEDDNDAS